jgi:AcrR family transcriptional regulator
MVQPGLSAHSAPTKKDIVAEFRRSEIVEAAKKVFARRGYRCATVDDIAEQAGIAKGTLYLYFKSKEEIYLTGLISDVRDLQQEASRRVAAANGTKDKVCEFVAVRLEHSEKHANFWRIFFSEFSNLAVSPAAESKEFQAALRRSVLQLEEVLEEGIEHHEIQSLPVERTALAILDLTRCVIERRLMGFVKSTAREDLAFVMNLLWDGMIPREPAPPARSKTGGRKRG